MTEGSAANEPVFPIAPVCGAADAPPSLGGIGLADGMTFSAQLTVQAAAAGLTALWRASPPAIVKLARLLTGLRVSREEDYDGLDLSVHSERAHDLTRKDFDEF